MNFKVLYLTKGLTQYFFQGDLSDVNRTNCDTSARDNAGCDVAEWSRASYGPFFEAQGGGVLAMKWDENDISVCEL